MSSFASNQTRALAQAAPYSAFERAADRLHSTLTRPDVIVVLSFCAVGLILTFAALAMSPDFASAFAEAGSMP